MNKEIRTLWITELRSDLPQEDASLKSIHGFSALGVLVDLYIRDTGLGKWENRKHFGENVIVETPAYRLVPLSHNVKDDLLPETPEKTEPMFTGLRDRVINDPETMRLPQEVMDWAGLEYNDVSLKPGSTVAAHKGDHLAAAYAIEKYL